MKKLTDITFAGVFIALLIGCQFALSGVAGVEIITPLLLSYCFYFGVVRGMVVASAFSLLRCLIFGISPTTVILYLVYYNLFALVFGLVGNRLRTRLTVPTFVLLTALSVLMTACFTLLDDVITPFFYGYTLPQMRIYFFASLAVMPVQCLSSLISVPLLVPPLLRAYTHLPMKGKNP